MFFEKKCTFFFFYSQILVMSTDNQNKGVPKIQILHVLATIAAVISLALIACLLAAMVYV